MNWTGGRLHRSGQQGALSKTQRQNFAKSRQLAIDKVSRQPSPFRGFPSLGRYDEHAVCEDDHKVMTGTQEQTTKPTVSHLPRSLSTKSDLLLDSVKRRLLQDPDWGAVSAARPLEIVFAPVEETEQFGKRRRLNDTDRKRLSAACGNQSFSGLAKSRRQGRDISPHDAILDQIQIQIDGRPTGHHSSDSQALSTNNASSQSMLLDHEEPVISHPSGGDNERINPRNLWTDNSNRLSLQPIYDRAPFSFPRPRTGTPSTPIYEGVESVDQDFSRIPGLGRLAANSPLHHRRVEPDRSVSQSPIAVNSPLPTCRRFTIDDQVLAEQMGRDIALASVRRPDREPSRSPASTLIASPTLFKPDALSCDTFSWVPRPQRLNLSSSPHLSRHAANFQESFTDEPYRQFSVNPFLDAPESDHCPPPVRLFGQLVQIPRGDGTDYM